MPELRRDPVTGRWVIISTDRQKRPHDFHFERALATGREHCPFCPGHEAMTPHEVLAYRPGGGAPDAPGWEIRVVPNKFPALQVEGTTVDREGDGMFDRMSGIGAHEVIIETPDHDRPLALLSEVEIERVLWAARERMLDLKRDFRLKYILIFKNHGAAAGATLEHPHAQLIALPIVPDFVRDEIEGARRHFAVKERCVFCDIVRQESNDGARVILETDEVLVISPYAPRFPFETWVLPRAHNSHFETAHPSLIQNVAWAMRAIIRKIEKVLEQPAYNFLIHTAPIHAAPLDHYHWHLEIIPRLTKVAGFEWGAGFYINPTPPEESAQFLRDAGL
jgi:UDPglucose--hexose-1-phosphate uridylyltransferase